MQSRLHTTVAVCNSPVTAGFGATAQLGIKMRKTRQEEHELSTCLRSEPRPPASGSAIHLWHSAATGQGAQPQGEAPDPALGLLICGTHVLLGGR